MARTTRPPTSKGVRFPFQVSVVAWGDLLGYGSEIADANFNPLDHRSRASISRLRRFHKLVADSSDRNFRTLVINDGVAAYRDLPLRGNSSVAYDFITRSWDLFEAINGMEIRNKSPGIRMVLAAGFRMRGRAAKVEKRHSKIESVLKKYKSGDIPAEQAILEASTARPSFDIEPLLQANFAFTKAYVAESSGSKGGLHGANFYLDMALLKNSSSIWPNLDSKFEWSHPKLGLQTCFGKVSKVPRLKFDGQGPPYLRTGHEVAQFLADDKNVLEALRSSSK